jgi:hypothetical protein
MSEPKTLHLTANSKNVVEIVPLTVPGQWSVYFGHQHIMTDNLYKISMFFDTMAAAVARKMQENAGSGL